MERTWTEDVSALFEACGIGVSKPLLALFNEATYEYDKKLKANWLYYAFLAFKLLAQSIKSPDLVAVIGVGSGLDGIAINETLHPRRLRMIDVNPGVMEVVRSNLSRYCKDTGAGVGWSVVLGNLCQPLGPESADMVYANIPTIPSSSENVLDGMSSSTFYDPAWTLTSPKLLLQNFLALQFEFLRESRVVLKPGGSAVIALGVRTSARLVTELFLSAGLSAPEAVVLDMKEQSQPELVVEAYAKQEQKQGVEFDFYRQEVAESNPASGLLLQEFKHSVHRWRVSANEALRLTRDGNKVYHVVAILRSTK